jgi:hypothetical protein
MPILVNRKKQGILAKPKQGFAQLGIRHLRFKSARGKYSRQERDNANRRELSGTSGKAKLSPDGGSELGAASVASTPNRQRHFQGRSVQPIK